jgi:copper(I)-binding protein
MTTPMPSIFTIANFANKRFSKVFVCVFVLSSMLMFNVKAGGHESTSQNDMASAVHINEPWARATFALAKTGAAYFSITNHSEHPVILSSVSVDKSIAMKAEIHTTVMNDNMMQMQELTDGIKINAGSMVELSPGGIHVMIMGLEDPLNKGESVSINLHFSDGSHLLKSFPIIDKRK